MALFSFVLLVPGGQVLGQESVTTPTQVGEAPSLEPVNIQVLLVRHGFIPGLIDGERGAQTKEALAAFQQSRGLSPSGEADEATRRALAAGQPTAGLLDYRITAEDAQRQFGFEFPAGVGKLQVLPPYEQISPAHYLAKKFRTTPDYIEKLNPEAKFEAGETIRVPNVPPMEVGR